MPDGVTSKVAPISFADLLEKELPPDQFWIEPGILPKRGTWLFGGEAKIGKSFIMLELARALATKTRPFGSHVFSVPEECRVLFIEQELGEYELKKRVKETFIKHKKHSFRKNVFALSKIPEMQLSVPDGVKLLVDAIDEVKPNIVMLDPISMFHGYDENNNSEIAELFRRIELIKKAYLSLDLSFVISHHFKKPPTYRNANDSFDDLSAYNFSGSQKWFNTPDTITTVKRVLTYPDNTGWHIRTRWVTRQGQPPNDMIFKIEPSNKDGIVQVYQVVGEEPRLSPLRERNNNGKAQEATEHAL